MDISSDEEYKEWFISKLLKSGQKNLTEEEQAISKYAQDLGLNGDLAVKQGLTTDNLDKLHLLHEMMMGFKGIAQQYFDDGVLEPYLAKPIAEEVERLEFEMQKAWGFEEDSGFHTHWLDLAGCTCPKMDNRDPLMNRGGRIIDKECPYHG